jgi:hypothetical protein
MNTELSKLLDDWYIEAAALRATGKLEDTQVADRLEKCANEIVTLTLEQEKKKGYDDIGLRIPPITFEGALLEVWHSLTYCAYHGAYVMAYLQTDALRVSKSKIDTFLQGQPQEVRDRYQNDVTLGRAHLSSFFWNLDHIFESLRLAIKRGRESGDLDPRTYILLEKKIADAKNSTEGREINIYRNAAHKVPGVIARWGTDNWFGCHFLPEIGDELTPDEIKAATPQPAQTLEDKLHAYFLFVANLCSGILKQTIPKEWKLPATFTFPVTIPTSFTGNVPADATMMLATWEPVPAPVLAPPVEGLERLAKARFSIGTSMHIESKSKPEVSPAGTHLLGLIDYLVGIFKDSTIADVEIAITQKVLDKDGNCTADADGNYSYRTSLIYVPQIDSEDIEILRKTYDEMRATMVNLFVIHTHIKDGATKIGMNFFRAEQDADKKEPNVFEEDVIRRYVNRDEIAKEMVSKVRGKTAIAQHHGNVLLWSEGVKEPTILTGYDGRVFAKALEMGLLYLVKKTPVTDGDIEWYAVKPQTCGLGNPLCGKPAVGWAEGPNGENRMPICQYHYSMLMTAKAKSA